MSDAKKVEKGELVTVAGNPYSEYSNTYRVAESVSTGAFLSHPLAPDLYIFKSFEALNTAFPSILNPVEKALHFCHRNKTLMGHSLAADLESLSFFFVVRKSFTNKQRTDLSLIYGKIASVILGNNLAAAVELIKQNWALLDDFSLMKIEPVAKHLENPKAPKTWGERFTLFNTAGFILAQETEKN